MRRLALAVESRLAAVLLLAAAFSGCSDDSAQTGCENCGAWTQLVSDLGRQPASHPADPNFVIYGTVRKNPGAPDESRESDEDLWLLWRGSDDPAQWVRWQLTADELGAGDNFAARWAPSGTKIAFVHTNEAGNYQAWSLDVVLPPGQPPDPAFDPSGTPTLIATDARDPAWLDEDTLLFARQDKIFRIDGIARGGSEVQVTFDPPTFVSSSSYIDRNPYVSSDGVAIFSTVGREEVADILIGAFRITPGSPPETTATSALIGLKSPTSPRLVYPLSEGLDTLVTPEDDSNPYLILHSLPSSEDPYVFGARRDSGYFPKGEETFCDTLLTQSVVLSPGETDTVKFFFEPARGSFLVASGRPFTTVRWERVDGRAESAAGELLEASCTWTTFDCVFSYQVDFTGEIVPGVLEPHYVIGTTNTGDADTVVTETAPGATTVVKVFCDADTCGCIPPEAERPIVAQQRNRQIRPRAVSAGGANIRAIEGEFSIWRMDLSDPLRPAFFPIISSDFSLQTPILTGAFGGGVRYLAYASDVDGDWGLYVQKLNAAFLPDGDPVRVATPGTFDNYVCDRDIYHPSWAAGSSPGNLRLLVTMTDCPDNGFEDFGFDDDPWNQGELNVWEVAVPY